MQNRSVYVFAAVSQKKLLTWRWGTPKIACQNIVGYIKGKDVQSDENIGLVFECWLEVFLNISGLGEEGTWS